MEWYVNTASFYRQIRNFKIDIRATDPNAYVCGIHYQVAQATSLQFVEIIANRATTQQGMCKLFVCCEKTWTTKLIVIFPQTRRMEAVESWPTSPFEAATLDFVSDHAHPSCRSETLTAANNTGG